jgi:hypothetical protein
LRGSLGAQRKSGQEAGEQDSPGKVPQIKFVTFYTKYVTKKGNLLGEVLKGRVCGSYGTRLQPKTVAWFSGSPQPELFWECWFLSEVFDGMPILPVRER